VYKGVYKRDPTQQVAVKITRRNTNYNQDKFRKYLEREMEFVRMKLQHPNVLQFIDYHDVRIDEPQSFPAQDWARIRTGTAKLSQPARTTSIS
jgi:hypothetical protein